MRNSHLYASDIFHPFKWLKAQPYILQERRSGCHTYAVFLGDDDVMVSGCNAFREKGVPEGAILLVESEAAATAASTKVPSLRAAQKSKGFAVDVGFENRYWPAGSPPESQEEEVRKYVVLPQPRNRSYECSNGVHQRGDNVMLKPPYRGYMQKGDKSDVTYWHAWVSEALLETEFYKKMKVAEGIQRGYVTVLKTVEEATEKCSAAGVEFKERWVDLRVVASLELRDRVHKVVRLLAAHARVSKNSAGPRESDDLFI